MKPKTVRKPLPGLALIYYLVLAITMARDLANLIETVRFYLENWNVAYQTLAAADLLLRATGLLLGGMMLWFLSHRDPRFQLTLILDIASRLLYLLMAMLLLRTAAPMAAASLVLSAVWYTYFRFSPKFAQAMAPDVPEESTEEAPEESETEQKS